jgi:hypothetical protein
MKYTIWLPTLLLFACTNKDQKNSTVENDTIKINADTITLAKPKILLPKTFFGNERFRKVTVEKVYDNKFRIKGQGQIFEANFNWVVEDGHEEIKKGFQMTDAGAPEWGNFDFVIEVGKVRESSTLTLILFETSAKDGSRQYELPISLD